MKTVLRNDKGEITHKHLCGRTYVTPTDHDKITQTDITSEMIENVNGKELLRKALNGDLELLEVKYIILALNGMPLTSNDIII